MWLGLRFKVVSEICEILWAAFGENGHQVPANDKQFILILLEVLVLEGDAGNADGVVGLAFGDWEGNLVKAIPVASALVCRVVDVEIAQRTNQ